MGKWIISFIAAVVLTLGISQAVYADTTSADGKYTYTVNGDGTTCTITDYKANENIVNVPASIDGYNVTNLGTVSYVPFVNKNMTQINIPTTITFICQGLTYGCQNLQEIKISSNSLSAYYDIDGVLYNGTTLWEYPAGKITESYTVPSGTATIQRESFNNPQYLKKLILPETVTLVCDAAFQYSVNPINVIYKHNSISTNLMAGSFYSMAAGSTVTVKTAALKTNADSILTQYGYGNMTVVVQSNPATSLTFTDGSTEKSITWDASKSYKLYDLYQMSAASGETTDIVTWSSTNTNMGSVNNSTQYATTGSRSGSFDLTGTSDSGLTIKLHVKVYIPTTSCTAPTNQSIQLDQSKSSSGNFYLTFDPITAYAAAYVTWTSSNPTVISIATGTPESTGDNGEGVTVAGSYVATNVGQSTITATVNDNGSVYTKSFVVTVDSDYYLPNHYIFYGDSIASSYNYTGSAISPAPIIYNQDYGYTISSYTVSYSNNVNAGTATVTVTGTGDYFGSISKTFSIVQSSGSASTGDTGSSGTSSGTGGSGTGSSGTTDQGETGVNQPETTAVSVPNYVQTYKKNRSFTVYVSNSGGSATFASSNKKVVTVSRTSGKATIKGIGVSIITVQTTNGTAQGIVSIVPSKNKIQGMSTPSRKSIRVEWTRDSSAKGYEVQISRVKDFSSNAKTFTVSSNKSTAKTIKSLTSKKYYYVRVRSYIIGYGQKYYGSWSTVKSIKVK